MQSVTLAIASSSRCTLDVMTKIGTSPSALKKVSQIAKNSIKGFNFYYSKDYFPSFVYHVSNINEIFDLYSTCKKAYSLTNRINKKTIDTEKLSANLSQAIVEIPNSKTIDTVALTSKLLNKVLNRGYFSERGLLTALKEALLEEGIFNEVEAEQIIKKTNLLLLPKAYLFSASWIDCTTSVCFNLCDLGSNYLYLNSKANELKKTSLPVLSTLIAKVEMTKRASIYIPKIFFKVHEKIGNTTVFSLASKIPLDVTLAGIGGIAQVLCVIKDVRTLTCSDSVLDKKQAMRDLFINTLEITMNMAWLAGYSYPPVFISLAIISKGTGLVFMFVPVKE